MVIPCLHFNIDVVGCFGGLWESYRQPKTEIQKMKKEIEKLKDKRNDIKNRIEKARRENRLASDEEAQSDLESMEGEVAAIFGDFTRNNFHDNIKLGPWGVLEIGDSKFDTGRCISKITMITVYSRAVVNSLEVSYVVDRKNVKTDRLGAEGGLPHNPCNLPENEYIETMSGFIVEYNGDSCITQLKFKTNLGKILGPFGTAKEGGKEFTVPMANGQIVGFFGYYGKKYLKAIGVYVAPIN